MLPTRGSACACAFATIAARETTRLDPALRGDGGEAPHVRGPGAAEAQAGYVDTTTTRRSSRCRASAATWSSRARRAFGGVDGH